MTRRLRATGTSDLFASTIAGKTTGALRASLGAPSNFADVYAYLDFARGFLDRPAQI